MVYDFISDKKTLSAIKNSAYLVRSVRRLFPISAWPRVLLCFHVFFLVYPWGRCRYEHVPDRTDRRCPRIISSSYRSFMADGHTFIPRTSSAVSRMPHRGENTGMSMLVRARFFLVYFFLLLISRRAQIRVQGTQCDGGGQSSARLSPEPCIFIHVHLLYKQRITPIRQSHQRKPTEKVKP